jgi:hypothetical protein
VVPTGTWNATLTGSTTLYGTSHAHWGPLAGIRHVVFPSISFRYSPDFKNLLYTDSQGFVQQRFTGFGGISVSGFRAADMAFSLDQRWQVKLQRKDRVERLDNLLQWSTSGSYDFLWKENRRLHPMTPLSSVLRVSPPGFGSADLNWITDPYSARPLRSLGYNVGINLSGAARSSNTPELPLEKRVQPDEVDFSEPWSLGLAFSYSGGYGTGPDWSSTQNANGLFRFNLTPNWRVEYSSSLDLTNRQLVTQRFGLVRDLHCWQASFTRIFVIGGEAEYYFRLAVKDQKELYIERGSRIGSLGGIQ